MAGSKIEWTDETWNPIVGCSIVSPGCTNCYAMKMAARIQAMTSDPNSSDAYRRAGQSHYDGTTVASKGGPVWTGKVALAPDSILTKPLHWKKPRRIFVNSMGDLFHESVPDAWIDRVFAVMALAPQHTFQVLTKRSARMRAYCSDPDTPRRIHGLVCDMVVTDAIAKVVLIAPGMDPNLAPPGPRVFLGLWPLANVWLGVSAEDQHRADERVPDLLAAPAAVRFVSAEPLLGPIDFTAFDVNGEGELDALNPRQWLDEIEQWRGTSETWEEDLIDWFNLSAMPTGGTMWPTLDWIIVGGESGPGARPMHPDWARSIRDQCAAAGVPFFFKQWGEHAWAERIAGDPSTVTAFRAGKRHAGRMLDGVTHDAMPEVRHG